MAKWSCKGDRPRLTRKSRQVGGAARVGKKGRRQWKRTRKRKEQAR